MNKKAQEIRITVRFPSELIDNLRPYTEKDKDDRSLNWEIVQAVREYVARKQREEAKHDGQDV